MKTNSVVLLAVGVLSFAQFAFAEDSLITKVIKQQRQESKIISNKDQYNTPEQFVTPYPAPSSVPQGQVGHRGFETRTITEPAGTQLTDLPAFQIHITHHDGLEIDQKFQEVKMNGPYVSNVGAPDQQWKGDILPTKEVRGFSMGTVGPGIPTSTIADTFKKVRQTFTNDSYAPVHHFTKKTLDKINSLGQYHADQTFSFFVDHQSGDIICKLHIRQPYPDGTFRKLSLLTSGKTFESAMEKAVDKILKDHELCEAEAFVHDPDLGSKMGGIIGSGAVKGHEDFGTMLLCAPKAERKLRKNADKPLDERVGSNAIVKKEMDKVEKSGDKTEPHGSKKEDTAAEGAK